MPPKKEKKGKKSAKAVTPVLINGHTVEEITKEQLERHVALLQEDLDREIEERNYFQLEKDQIYSFWKITERKLEVANAELKNLDKAAEDHEGKHQIEIQVYRQKMKHLLCEHQNTLTELKAHGFGIPEALRSEHDQLETELCDKMRSIKKEIQEQDNEDCINELNLKHEQDMNLTRTSYDKKKDLETKAKSEKMLLLKEEMENLTKSMITEQELMWDSHINELWDDHWKKITELNAMAYHQKKKEKLIEKEEKKLAEKKAKLLEVKKNARAVLQECQRLYDLVSKIRAEIDYAEKKTKACSMAKDISERAMAKAIYDLQVKFEEMEEKYKKLQLERDKLLKLVPQKIERTKHDFNLECAPLEKKMVTLTENLEKIQTQLDTLLPASTVDHVALKGIIHNVARDLEAKNTEIKHLELKKTHMWKNRRNINLAIEAKEALPCIPTKQLKG